MHRTQSTAALQIENGKLLQHVLDLRRTMRECNCTGPGIDLSSDQVASGLHLLPPAQLNKPPADESSYEQFTKQPTDATDASSQSTASQSRILDSSESSNRSSKRSTEAHRDPVDQLAEGGAGAAKSSQSAISREAPATRTQHEHNARRHGSQDLQLEAASD